MTSKEIREAYLRYYAQRDHAVVSSTSLVPENDPTTLFTSAGMQSMIPYLMGKRHPLGKRLMNSQKSFRSQDIAEVGDNRHTTFFEMLGNWSFGDYFKEDQINWVFDFLVNTVKLDPNRLYVSVFKGNSEFKLLKDTETVVLWQKKFGEYDIDANVVEYSKSMDTSNARIFLYGDKNWWSRAGSPSNMPKGEIGGPDTEIFWDFGPDRQLHEKSPFREEPCHINCDCGRFLEIGNSVFMQYIKTESGFAHLPSMNVDFGGGLERITAASVDNPDVFSIDLFCPLIAEIERLSGKAYGQDDEECRSFRVIADHIRAASFLINDGVLPSNKERGYFVRRLIRRSLAKARHLGITSNFARTIGEKVCDVYRNIYKLSYRNIGDELEEEESRFRRTLEKGVRQISTMISRHGGYGQKQIDGKDLFNLYQTYGFPLELSIEELEHYGSSVSSAALEQYETLLKAHQQNSRTTSAGMFKGGLQDSSERTTKLHTAAHLLLAALRQVLGEHVQQRGSNITSERLRFDFSHSEKLSDEQLAEIERIVNEQIRNNLPVTHSEMTVERAKALGALGVFEHKYGERVNVYSIGTFSKEICGGPHINYTGDMGEFRVQKEEASSAGVRRIKAILEDECT